MTRWLALDHGSRRIGLAVGDDETGMAFARPALRRRGAADVKAVAELAARESTRQVLVGLPLLMDGREGSQAATVRRFGLALEGLGLTVTYADERLSSWEAREELNAARRRPSRASGALDSTAARLILQHYLDARSGRLVPQEP